jgi:excisionase family DNA binding protein
MAAEQIRAEEVVRKIVADPEALAALRRALGAEAPAYTVATLARVLGVSERVVRNAIWRGELAAVRRGSRWVIAAVAVEAWAHGGRAPTRQRRTAQRRQGLADTFAQIDRRAGGRT